MAVLNPFAANAPALINTNNTTVYGPSTSWTPTAGDLLVVGVALSGTVATAPTLTASANGITFRLVDKAASNASADTQYVFIADQLVPGSPSAMTLTFNCPADAATGVIMSVASVSGMSRVGTAAVRQQAKVENVAGGTAPQTVFASSVLTGDPTLFFVQINVGTGMTPPPGWTERVDATNSLPTKGAGYASRDSGFTGTTITLGSTTNGTCSAIALELDTSSTAVTANVEAAADADTAIDLDASKATTLGHAADADHALDVASSKATSLEPAASADAAHDVTSSKSAALQRAADADEALDLAASKTATLGAAAGRDAALDVGVGKQIILEVASDRDEALDVAVMAEGQIILEVAADRDEALQLGGVGKVVILERAVEVSHVPALVVGKAAALAAAAEHSAARQLAVVKSLGLGVAADRDLALDVFVFREPPDIIDPSSDGGPAQGYSTSGGPASDYTSSGGTSTLSSEGATT